MTIHDEPVSEDQGDQDAAMVELADEATDRQQITDTASAHGWAMFATTDRHYGFRRGDAWVAASFSEPGAVLDAERAVAGQQNQKYAPAGHRLETVLAWLSAGEGVTGEALTSGNTDSDRVAELEAQIKNMMTVAIDRADADAARIRELEAQLARVAADLTDRDRGIQLTITDYSRARARITELEDQRGPLRAAARDLADSVTTEGRSTARTLRIADRVREILHGGSPTLRGLRPDLVIMDEILDDPELAQPATVRDALVALDLDPAPGLPGEGQLIRESVPRVGGPALVRVIGTLDIASGKSGADVLWTDDRSDAVIVPVGHIADYVALVRALGVPSPARRRAALAEVLAASMPHR